MMHGKGTGNAPVEPKEHSSPAAKSKMSYGGKSMKMGYGDANAPPEPKCGNSVACKKGGGGGMKGY